MNNALRPIGFIADDITGATDLASVLATRGVDVRLAFGTDMLPADTGDAVVVALKIRSVPATEARSAAQEAAKALQAVGAEQIFSKYCSTFDSTAEGNIGPVTDALIDLAGSGRVVHCPSYPANGRTVYQGHLFVWQELLSDSPMRNHPLNPMRDPQLRRVLAEQTPHAVDSVYLSTVDQGPGAISDRLAEIGAQHTEAHHVIVDAVRDSDLDKIAVAAADDRVAAGGAAFGAAFAVAVHERSGRDLAADPRVSALPPGPAAILAGSLSRATQEQVRNFDGPTLTLNVQDLVDGEAALRKAADFVENRISDGPMLITTDHNSFGASIAEGLSSAQVSRRVELAMGDIAVELERLGVRRFIIAGGETSGAVAEALNLRSARIGPDISVGVPWIVAEDRGLALAFKSGNFGGPLFFSDALERAGK
ncbi:3-oxo-tetronate kinase [Arthrobacter sp. YN]|uniref:3-oxo-tetronate kinase n=1 Tax=Arthrobacter sp. YN TaxID=2020486 RepID=UPI000B5F2AC1|nr:3-oxo-tetronate kinase [Arthrobacter sp. YN]ASN19996.1 hypothetical protein CGK93_10150 [Arthrobacter sp. YN]